MGDSKTQETTILDKEKTRRLNFNLLKKAFTYYKERIFKVVGKKISHPLGRIERWRVRKYLEMS